MSNLSGEARRRARALRRARVHSSHRLPPRDREPSRSLGGRSGALASRLCLRLGGATLFLGLLLLLAALGPELRVRREDHEHLPAFEARRLLDHAELLDVFGHLLEEALTDLLVGDLAPAEHDGDARLVALLQEPADVTDLDLVIVLVGLRPQLD